MDIRSSECDVVSLCVALLMCLFVFCVACLTVLVKQFAMCLGVVAILLLNVMDVFSVCVVVLCWIYHVRSSKECVCCACNPNEHLGAPSICFVCVFVCRMLSPHLGV